MPKFNPNTYDPQDDSSQDRRATGHPRWGKSVILSQTLTTNCACGCDSPPKGKHRSFQMGHDARLRGILIRAHLTGTRIIYVRGDGSSNVYDAIEAAERYGWEQYLVEAQDRLDARRQAKADRSNATIMAKATGPQIGDKKLIRVGRWDYTGQVVAIYDDGEELEIEFTTKSGEVKTVRKPKAEVA